jgi:mRNA interferase MazF
VDQEEILTQGGIYLARLDPSKAAEVGKIRPVVVLTAQIFLNITPPTIFICPLSSQSKPEFGSLHVELMARDNLQVVSYALVEHCRSISICRIIYPRIAQLSITEVSIIAHRLQKLMDV